MGKSFTNVRDEDPNFVRWVLRQNDFRNNNLRAFADYCCAAAQEEAALIAAAAAAEAEHEARRAARMRELTTSEEAAAPLLSYLVRLSHQKNAGATLLSAASVCRDWQRLAGQAITEIPGPALQGAAQMTWSLAGLRAKVASIRLSQPPWFVDLVGGDDTAAGKETTPLLTLERAEQRMQAYCSEGYGRGYDDQDFVMVVRCDPATCTLNTCSRQGCNTRVCNLHGYGRATWVHGDVQELSFRVTVCAHDTCTRAFCALHEGELCICTVCENGIQANANIGAYNMDEVGQRSRWCYQHLTMCHGWRWRKQELVAQGRREPDSDDGEEEDGEEEDEEESSGSDYDEEGGDKWDCGFNCCPDCFVNHKCGDDPTEYT